MKFILIAIVLYVIFMRVTVPSINAASNERLRKNTNGKPTRKGSKFADEEGDYVDYEEVKD